MSPDLSLCVLNVCSFGGIKILLCCLCVVLFVCGTFLLFFFFEVRCCLLVWDVVCGICLFFVRLIAVFDVVLFCVWLYEFVVDCVLALCCF